MPGQCLLCVPCVFVSMPTFLALQGAFKASVGPEQAAGPWKDIPCLLSSFVRGLMVQLDPCALLSWQQGNRVCVLLAPCFWQVTAALLEDMWGNCFDGE